MRHKRTAVRQHFAAFKTALGWLGIGITEKGIARLALPQTGEKEVLTALRLNSETAYISFEHLDDIISRIQAYCEGQYLDFSETLDLSSGSIFEQQVWSTCRSIPYGHTRSYGWLATQIGCPKAARAVGNALGKNPIPIIIPCHRIIAANGSIGGFTGGLDIKRRLLMLEGIRFP
ncbi:MAG: MGMT family protein [Dehalococcoidia bacterium]|nr:MGMT family protein [Dehalococcoidia bacterium]